MIKFIIPIIVGAIIGYITNWLAIKMLFRPHTEKRIMGIKVPFTPGLIPKERKRIAKSVGDTVGNHLLSPEMIIESLGNDEVSGQVEKWIDERINGLRNSDITVGEWLRGITGDSYEKTIYGIEGVLNKLVLEEMQKTENRELILRFIDSKIESINIIDSKVYKTIISEIKLGLRNGNSINALREVFEAIIAEKVEMLGKSEKRLGDLISPNITNSAKVYIYNHKEEIADLLRDILNDEKVHDKLKSSISTMIELNFGKLVTMFMNPESIAIKIIVAAINYLNKPEVQDNIALAAVKLVDNVLDKKASEIMQEIPANSMEEALRDLSNSAIEIITMEENQNLIIGKLEEELTARETLIKKYISSEVSNAVNGILSSEEFSKETSNLIHFGISKLLNREVKSIFEGIEEEELKSVKKLIIETLRNIINNKAGYFAEIIDIPSIVEDKINSFDVEFAEKLILDVARKELSAITWLGALLGAIMGVISPLLEMLTR